MGMLYKPFGYKPNPIEPDKCRASVHNGGRGGGFHQCPRNPKVQRKVKGHRGKVGFCKQHDPEAVAARDAERRERWDAENLARDRVYQMEELELEITKALLEADVELPPKLERLVKRYRKLQSLVAQS